MMYEKNSKSFDSKCRKQEKVKELDGSWSAMKSYNRKCEDFIGNMDPLKGSKAGKGHNQISF